MDETKPVRKRKNKIEKAVFSDSFQCLGKSGVLMANLGVLISTLTDLYPVQRSVFCMTVSQNQYRRS